MESTLSSAKLQAARITNKFTSCAKKNLIFACLAGQDVVHMIERVRTTTDDEPVEAVILTECGDVKVEKPFFISDNPYDIWGWVKAAAVPLTMSFTIFSIFQHFIRKLDQFT